MMTTRELQDEIIRLKKENDICILAHAYQSHEILEVAEPTHINLFDDTIEGLRYKNKNVFSVQFHPESSPGPHESKYLFKEFLEVL